jgi:hypothetical protein
MSQVLQFCSVESELGRLRQRVFDLERALAERQQTLKQQIRENQTRFSLFMDNLPGCAWMKDPQVSWFSVNRSETAFC